MTKLEQVLEALHQATLLDGQPNAVSCNTLDCNYMQIVPPGPLPCLSAASYCL
jgi:hypothetical protein